MTWNPISEPQDFVLLAGQRTPGLAELTGFDSSRRWHVRKGYGLSGATVVFRGIDLAEKGKLLIRLTTEEDWADWEAFAPLVQRPPIGERARALDISHPITDGLGIRSVVVKNVHQPTQTGDGEWTITIELIEYRRPEYALARPEGSEAQELDAAERQMAVNSTTIMALSHELAGS